jgi:hypothetical protein
MVLALDEFLGYEAGTKKYSADRPEQLTGKQHTAHYPATELKRRNARIDLRDYLAKKQKKEGEENRYAKKL